jgi:hypothetical protein
MDEDDRGLFVMGRTAVSATRDSAPRDGQPQMAVVRDMVETSRPSGSAFPEIAASCARRSTEVFLPAAAHARTGFTTRSAAAVAQASTPGDAGDAWFVYHLGALKEGRRRSHPQTPA